MKITLDVAKSMMKNTEERRAQEREAENLQNIRDAEIKRDEYKHKLATIEVNKILNRIDIMA